jgi:hypothetical protein
MARPVAGYQYKHKERNITNKHTKFLKSNDGSGLGIKLVLKIRKGGGPQYLNEVINLLYC